MLYLVGVKKQQESTTEKKINFICNFKPLKSFVQNDVLNDEDSI